MHISGLFCVIFKTFCSISINLFFLTELCFCGFVINLILPLKNSCTHRQPGASYAQRSPWHNKKGLRYARSSGDEILLGHLWPTDYVNTLSKHETLTKCWSNAGPPSATLTQQLTSTGSTPRVCWPAGLAMNTPANTRHLDSVGLMLGQRRIWCANIFTMFLQM